MSAITKEAKRITKYKPFDIRLQEPLAGLPVNLLWRGTVVKVFWIGFKADVGEDVPLERYWDVGDADRVEYEPAEIYELLTDNKAWKGGTHDEARSLFETVVFPKLREVFADELEEAREAAAPLFETIEAARAMQSPALDKNYDPIQSPTLIPEKEEVERGGLISEKVRSAPAKSKGRTVRQHRQAEAPAG